MSVRVSLLALLLLSPVGSYALHIIKPVHVPLPALSQLDEIVDQHCIATDLRSDGTTEPSIKVGQVTATNLTPRTLLQAVTFRHSPGKCYLWVRRNGSGANRSYNIVVSTAEKESDRTSSNSFDIGISEQSHVTKRMTDEIRLETWSYPTSRQLQLFLNDKLVISRFVASCKNMSGKVWLRMEGSFETQQESKFNHLFPR